MSCIDVVWQLSHTKLKHMKVYWLDIWQKFAPAKICTVAITSMLNIKLLSTMHLQIVSELIWRLASAIHE